MPKCRVVPPLAQAKKHHQDLRSKAEKFEVLVRHEEDYC